MHTIYSFFSKCFSSVIQIDVERSASFYNYCSDLRENDIREYSKKESITAPRPSLWSFLIRGTSESTKLDKRNWPDWCVKYVLLWYLHASKSLLLLSLNLPPQHTHTRTHTHSFEERRPWLDCLEDCISFVPFVTGIYAFVPLSHTVLISSRRMDLLLSQLVTIGSSYSVLQTPRSV